jgi:hypothetical protein
MVEYFEEKNKFYKIDKYGKKIQIRYEKFKSAIEKKGNLKLYSIIEGGFGNKLFMIFNILNLYIENQNRCFNLVEKKNKNIKKRKSITNYHFFKKLNEFIIDNVIYDKNLKILKEKSFEFNKLKLNHYSSYEINGYFQSYKYFNNNIEKIKKFLNLDKNLIQEIKSCLTKLNKKTIALHYRLDDYLEIDIYNSFNRENYYKKVLSLIDINEYQIILFTDQIEEGKKRLNKYCSNFICADDYFQNDEHQFFMMSCCDIIIGVNSSFSLMSTIINNMYKFNKESKYFFPFKWFSESGPNYNINDLIPNNNERYNIIEI